MRTIGKITLFSWFSARIVSMLRDSNGKLHTGIISSIQHEDGSGSSFNITLENGEVFHLRTID